MSRGRQKIIFEGLMQRNVLGSFDVIRGFADLRDLAAVSAPMPYECSNSGQISGYQRLCDEKHVGDIERFLISGRYRFFPEIILSLTSTGPSDPVVSYAKRRASKNDMAYRVTVTLKELAGSREHEFTPIRRIDGNHRLVAAEHLYKESRRSADFKDFATVPFCFVLLSSDQPEDDELAEAMLFNLINSKALPIASEHSLRVLMRDDGPAQVRFTEDPEVYLTRWINDRVRTWPNRFYEALGDSPLTRIHAAAHALLRPGGISASAMAAMEKQAKELFDPLYELAARLRVDHEGFVLSYAFLPVAAEVYTRHTRTDKGPGANTTKERLRRAERWLLDFANWFERVGGEDLPVPADPCVLWEVFKRDYDRKAGQVFVAMSFAQDKTLVDVSKAVKEAIDGFNGEHPNAMLDPCRVDEQKGASYEIPARVFNEIDRSHLVIADLTDEKPNVYCEVGYAKSKGIPFILTFHRESGGTTPPWDRVSQGGNRVHFDLVPYRYIAYDNPLNLRDELRKELNAWHAQEPK